MLGSIKVDKVSVLSIHYSSSLITGKSCFVMKKGSIEKQKHEKFPKNKSEALIFILIVKGYQRGSSTPMGGKLS